MDLSNDGRLPGVEERLIFGIAGQGAECFSNDQMALAQSCQALLKEARMRPRSSSRGGSSRGAGSLRRAAQSDVARSKRGSASEILDISFDDIFGCSDDASLRCQRNAYDESARMLEFLNRAEAVGQGH